MHVLRKCEVAYSLALCFNTCVCTCIRVKIWFLPTFSLKQLYQFQYFTIHSYNLTILIKLLLILLSKWTSINIIGLQKAIYNYQKSYFWIRCYSLSDMLWGRMPLTPRVFNKYVFVKIISIGNAHLKIRFLPSIIGFVRRMEHVLRPPPRPVGSLLLSSLSSLFEAIHSFRRFGGKPNAGTWNNANFFQRNLFTLLTTTLNFLYYKNIFFLFTSDN